MINYNDEYRMYYEGLRGKVKGKDKERKDSISSSNKDIIPKKREIQVDSYKDKINGYGGAIYTRNNYGGRGYSGVRGTYSHLKNIKDETKKFGYMDKIIVKLIITLLLVLAVFIFKISPDKNIKLIYDSFDKQINKTYDFTFAKDIFNKLGIDVDTLMEDIENKATDVMKEILD